jgi:hypothetical protein
LKEEKQQPHQHIITTASTEKIDIFANGAFTMMTAIQT